MKCKCEDDVTLGCICEEWKANPLSKCCKAEVEVVGINTKWFECIKCGYSCDLYCPPSKFKKWINKLLNI